MTKTANLEQFDDKSIRSAKKRLPEAQLPPVVDFQSENEAGGPEKSKFWLQGNKKICDEEL